MSNLKGCFMHNSDDWKTPSDIYKRFIDAGYVDCFPFHADYDEFQRSYVNQKLFVNPPYSKLSLLPSWIKLQLDQGCSVVLLIPARTDTSYFHEFLKIGGHVVFIRGRLHFNDSKKCAPFPSIYIVFDRK